VALDAIPHGICILDAEGNVVRVNRGIEKLQGENPPDIISRSPAVLFQEPRVFEKLLARAAEFRNGHVEKTDVNLMNPTGEAYLADLNLVRISDASGFSGYLLVIEVLTKRRPSRKR